MEYRGCAGRGLPREGRERMPFPRGAVCQERVLDVSRLSAAGACAVNTNISVGYRLASRRMQCVGSSIVSLYTILRQVLELGR
jgi:hypothetical protein